MGRIKSTKIIAFNKTGDTKIWKCQNDIVRAGTTKGRIQHSRTAYGLRGKEVFYEGWCYANYDDYQAKKAGKEVKSVGLGKKPPTPVKLCKQKTEHEILLDEMAVLKASGKKHYDFMCKILKVVLELKEELSDIKKKD